MPSGTVNRSSFMFTLKTLVSALTAVATAAGIGLVYAQTSGSDSSSTMPPPSATEPVAPTDRTGATMPDAATPGTATTPQGGASMDGSGAPSPSDMAPAPIDEPAPQADRG
jgi:hypothetical protein